MNQPGMTQPYSTPQIFFHVISLKWSRQPIRWAFENNGFSGLFIVTALCSVKTDIAAPIVFGEVAGILATPARSTASQAVFGLGRDTCLPHYAASISLRITSD
jgi:hypothetical protein